MKTKTPEVQPIVLGRDICGDFDAASQREWLVTNGIGGFACGTVAGAAARRYHGLLVASLRPPVARTVTLVKADAIASYRGERVELGSNEYADGTRNPSGHRYIQQFRLEGTVPTWTFAVADALLESQVFMARGLNTTYLRFTLTRAAGPLVLELTPLVAWRDYHWHQHGGARFEMQPADRGCLVTTDGGHFRILAEGGRFESAPDWHWNLLHAAERARGLDDREDLFRPGRFLFELEPGQSVALIATTEAAAAAPSAETLAALRGRECELLRRLGADAPDMIRRLALAADQFIVTRAGGDAAASGSTVIAGYPWFTDWGRDTMIALPGLTLDAGRPEIAREVLATFAQHVDQGLLPNRFPDGSEPPEYNTVDATLWYFQAIGAYLRATGDDDFAAALYPVLSEIVAWHDRGTRYGIAVDPADGLLRSGEPGVQLTWMDARIGDWVVTPRTGKAVEINALWHGALLVLADLSRRLDKSAAALEYRRRAAAVARAFNTRFWNEAAGCLYDVVDVPGTAEPDATLRPNQLIACALPGGLLETGRMRRIVDVCAARLLTSFGLRSLAPGLPGYAPRYAGGPLERDSAYHQGTVWTWLIGPFVRAHLNAWGDPPAAQSYLEPIAQHLADACIGQVSEVFDAEPPHRPGGCFAQAWSVAEVISAWSAARRAARPVKVVKGIVSGVKP
jgi:predicted glycogen debranching enzyme